MKITFLINQSGKYLINLDRMGHYEVTRFADGAEVYLQGDDAGIFRDEIEHCQTDTDFDNVCSNYDEVMRK